MNNHRFSLLKMGLLIVALVVTFTLTNTLTSIADNTEAKPQTVQWGQVTYPLTGNLRSSAGTIIVHFSIDGKFDKEPGAWYYPQENWFRFLVAELKPNKTNSMLLYWYKGSGSRRGYINAYLNTLPEPIPGNRISDSWQPDTQHWLALTWDAQGNFSFWVDGQLAGGQGVNPALVGVGEVTEDGVLSLGRGNSPLTIYAVHVLDHALSPTELRGVSVNDVESHLFKPMKGSLILDRFDQQSFAPDGKHQTDAEVISGFSDETGGMPTKGCHFVDTPFGRGLRLYTRLSGE